MTRRTSRTAIGAIGDRAADSTHHRPLGSGRPRVSVVDHRRTTTPGSSPAAVRERTGTGRCRGRRARRSTTPRPTRPPRSATALTASTDGCGSSATTTNAGHIASVNEGFAALDGEYLVKLDADDLLAPGALARATALLEARPEVGFVTGRPLHFTTDTGPPADPASRRGAGRTWPGRSGWRSRCRQRVSTSSASPEVVTCGPPCPARQSAPAPRRSPHLRLRLVDADGGDRRRGPGERAGPGLLPGPSREPCNAPSTPGILFDLEGPRDAFEFAVAFAGRPAGHSCPAPWPLHATGPSHASPRQALDRACRAYERGRTEEIECGRPRDVRAGGLARGRGACRSGGPSARRRARRGTNRRPRCRPSWPGPSCAAPPKTHRRAGAGNGRASDDRVQPAHPSRPRSRSKLGALAAGTRSLFGSLGVRRRRRARLLRTRLATRPLPRRGRLPPLSRHVADSGSLHDGRCQRHRLPAPRLPLPPRRASASSAAVVVPALAQRRCSSPSSCGRPGGSPAASPARGRGHVAAPSLRCTRSASTRWARCTRRPWAPRSSLGGLVASSDPESRHPYRLAIGAGLAFGAAPRDDPAAGHRRSWSGSSGWPEAPSACVLLVLGVAAVVPLSWTARNVVVMHGPVLGSTNNGLNLLLGNSEDAGPRRGWPPTSAVTSTKR